MLPIERQEAYRRRYARMRPLWRPSSQIYQDLVAMHLGPDVRVLDLGCGRGGVMERLHDRARFATGIDPDFLSLQEHRAPVLPLVCGRARRLPYGDESFDVVCCSWVLEHLPDPAAAFAEVHRVLVRGGFFVFLTPNACHPLLVLNRLLAGTRGWLIACLYDRAEVDVFPALYRANIVQRIERLARGAGLRRVRLETVGDPTYIAFNEVMFRLGAVIQQLTPAALRVHLIGLHQATDQAPET